LLESWGKPTRVKIELFKAWDWHGRCDNFKDPRVFGWCAQTIGKKYRVRVNGKWYNVRRANGRYKYTFLTMKKILELIGKSIC
jgi:hypothetical protein